MMKRRDGWLVLAGLVAAMAVGGCRKEDGGRRQASAAAATEPAAGVAEAAGEGVAAAQAPSRAARAERPAFRERMSPKQFDQRFKKAVAELPAVAEREKEKGAAWGYRLTAVDKGSAGEKAGLKVGDTIVGIDGVRAWSEFRLGKLRKDVPQTLKVVGEDLKARDVVVPPGRIGVRGERRWEPELMYLRGPHRDAKWDNLVRVALGWMWNEPRLAETAMTRALSKGYPADGVSDLVGYATSLPNMGEPERTLEFARLREGSGEYGADMPAWPAPTYYAAIAEGDLKTAAEALPDGVPDALEDTSRQLEQLKAAAAKATTRPAADRQTPTEMALRMKRTPLIPLCRGLNSWADTYLDHLNKVGGALRFFAPGGHFAPFVIRSIKPAQDVEVDLLFKTRPSDNVKTAYSRMVAVGLMDLDDQRPEPGLDQDGTPGGILGLAYWAEGGWMSVYHGYGEQIVYRPATFKNEDMVNVKLLHVGGWDEVFVNDERVAYLPWTAPCKKMALYVKSVGMDLCIEHIAYDALEDGPAKQ